MAFVLIGIALLLAFFAYHIGMKKRVHLLAGYQAGAIKDEAGLARWMGKVFLTMAALSGLLGILCLLLPGYDIYFLMADVVVIVMGAMIASFRTKTF